MKALTFATTVAGILDFIYVVFVGQKSIQEWFRDRRTAKEVLIRTQSQLSPPISIPPRFVQHTSRTLKLQRRLR